MIGLIICIQKINSHITIIIHEKRRSYRKKYDSHTETLLISLYISMIINSLSEEEVAEKVLLTE